MTGMATLPQGNQELLVVTDKVGRPPGELGVSKSMECDIFPSVLWHCWLGDRKGIRPIKKLDVGLLVVMIWLELYTTYISRSPAVTTTSIILCFNPGSPGKWPLKWRERGFAGHCDQVDQFYVLLEILRVCDCGWALIWRRGKVPILVWTQVSNTFGDLVTLRTMVNSGMHSGSSALGSKTSSPEGKVR